MNKSSWCIASVRSAKKHDNTIEKVLKTYLINNEKRAKIKLPSSFIL